MTRSVADSALVLQAIAGYDPLDPSTVPVPVPDYSDGLGGDLSGMTAGVPANYFFDEVDSEVEASVRAAIAALQELGVTVREVSLPSMEYVGALRAASLSDGVVTHEPYLASDRDKYGPNVIYRTLAGQFVLGPGLLQGHESPAHHQGGIRPGAAGRGLPGYAHSPHTGSPHRCGGY